MPASKEILVLREASSKSMIRVLFFIESLYFPGLALIWDERSSISTT